jgi:ADP-heptose:LPS heptosyltransferase
MSKKALLIRLDRIGDLVLTLPADQQPALRDYECTWYISKGLGFVAQHSQPPRHFVEWKKEFSFSQFFAFLKSVRELKPDLSVSFQSPAWVMIALFIARVPLRIGVLSRWPSFLFLNRGIRQKRSQVLHHELEYNHLLVHEGLKDPSPVTFPYLKLQAHGATSGAISTRPDALALPYVIVHPGMAGSALNWPRSHYKELIEKLSRNISVVITGTATDQAILWPLKKDLNLVKNIIWLDGKLSGSELLSVISKAQALFAPSTGVIHLAASLGIPTYGVYSPIKVETAKRWGPRGPDVHTFTPDMSTITQPVTMGVVDPQCMALVTPEEIYNNMIAKLN